MAGDEILTKPDGTAIVLSILPFAVLKIGKGRIAVRFAFGGPEVYELDKAGKALVIGEAKYPFKQFEEYSAGLFQ
jgi:hypothetical protein